MDSREASVNKGTLGVLIKDKCPLSPYGKEISVLQFQTIESFIFIK